MASETKILRCAIYTRKSTEHGLEQEFNSLDAQRDACEGLYQEPGPRRDGRPSPSIMTTPAYSGGNLDRPALKKLLADIEAGRIDVVVVYKIDRLTRSLADFAKLVEAFDARSISFCGRHPAVQHDQLDGTADPQTCSLSFAQFERELSSERVRGQDRGPAGARANGPVAPSRSGYDGKDKKLVVSQNRG